MLAVRDEVMYGLSNGIKIFDLRRHLKVKGQGQTLKSLKSNISKTVRDREKVSMEVRKEVMRGLSSGIEHLISDDL